MSTFFAKPTGGPDIVGGVWPVSQKARCINRAGATLSKGDVVMLDMTATTTEIATNDDNSYIPGASNDTVWNTIVDPTAASITNGSIFGVVLETEILDNGSGEVQFFGLVSEAYVTKNSGTTNPGDVLSVTTTNSFNSTVASNQVNVGWYLDGQDTDLEPRELKRVFLHNGLFAGHGSVKA